MWYPYKLREINALSGRYVGSVLPYLAEPALMSLGDWREKHADSQVLVGGE